jgi:hypothetical protein
MQCNAVLIRSGARATFLHLNQEVLREDAKVLDSPLADARSGVVTLEMCCDSEWGALSCKDIVQRLKLVLKCAPMHADKVCVCDFLLIIDAYRGREVALACRCCGTTVCVAVNNCGPFVR